MSDQKAAFHPGDGVRMRWTETHAKTGPGGWALPMDQWEDYEVEQWAQGFVFEHRAGWYVVALDNEPGRPRDLQLWPEGAEIERVE